MFKRRLTSSPTPSGEGVFLEKSDGENHNVNVVAVTGSTETIDLSTGNYQDFTLDDDCTFTMPTVGAGKTFTAFVRQDGTGGWTPTFTDVEWPDDTPPEWATTPDTVDIVEFVSDASVWYGFAGGGEGGGSGGGPVVSHGTMGATETFDASAGSDHEGTLDEDLTVTLTGATAGDAAWLTLILTQDGTGGNDITWPGSVSWPGGVAPTIDQTAGAVNIISLVSYDGGTNWYGSYPGAGGSSSLDVTDDTTTVTTVGSLEFDPADFDVTDEGGGVARVSFVGSASGGVLPLTAVVDDIPMLVWDEDNSLIPVDI